MLSYSTTLNSKQITFDVFSEFGPWSYLNCTNVVASQINSGLQGDAHLDPCTEQRHGWNVDTTLLGKSFCYCSPFLQEAFPTSNFCQHLWGLHRVRLYLFAPHSSCSRCMCLHSNFVYVPAVEDHSFS